MGKEGYMKVESMAENTNDFRNLADSILENLGDQEWAKKVYNKAKSKARYPSDFDCLNKSIFKSFDEYQ